MATKVSHHWLVFISRIVLVLIILGITLLPLASRVEASFSIPTIEIITVVAQNSVTIRADYWPPNETFTIRMGQFGTLAVGGTVVATTTSGSGGPFEATYLIPEYLKNEPMIAIRADSSTGFFYSYNWFYNINSGPQPETFVAPSSDTTLTSVTVPVYNGIPSFSIASVAKDNTVTILTSNFPPGQTFTVRMAENGVTGLGGIEVGTTESGEGGAFEATYAIPESLKGLFQISIRMESNAGYYSYNWFYNNTSE